MGMLTFQDDQGAFWEVNPDAVVMIVRQHMEAHLLRSRSQMVTEGGLWGAWESEEYWRMDLSMEGFAAERESIARQELEALWSLMQVSGQRAFDRLFQMRLHTVEDNAELQRQAQRVSQHNYERLRNHVRRGEAGAMVSRDILGASAAVLCILVAPLAATAGLGYAAASLGGGSVLSGVGTYHDTGRAELGLLTANTTFVAGIFTLGAGPAIGTVGGVYSYPGHEAASAGSQRILLFMGTQTDAVGQFGTAMAEGSTVERAASDAIIDAVGGESAGELAERAVQRIRRSPVPVHVQLAIDEAADHVPASAAAGRQLREQLDPWRRLRRRQWEQSRRPLGFLLARQPGYQVDQFVRRFALRPANSC